MIKKVILFLLFCFITFSFNSYAQITSHFTANPQNGCASSGHPLTVHFIDASLGSHKWRWFYNFDTTIHSDTSSPFISSPFHSYTIAGTYVVKQVLYDSLGNKDSSYKTVVVTPQPIVRFTTPDTLHFCPPHTVVFTNTSDTTAGCSLTFNWYIDTTVKHTTHLNQTVSYTFTQPGTYDIALTETESCNCGPSNLTKHAYIHVDSFSTPCFNTNDTSGCGAPYTVHFTNCSVGAATYLWNFGDGTSDTATNPIHIYNATNTTGYSDTLTSYSIGGCPTTKIKVHNIKVGHFNPGFQTYLAATPTVSTTVICINSSLTLKDTTFGSTNHHWRFSAVSGDTVNTNLTTFGHLWVSTGLYHVSDSSWNTTGCSGVATHDIYVPLNPIIDSITANHPYRCTPPDSVQFISWVRDTFSYSKIWHFGEPTLGSLDTAYSDSMHVYNSSGLFSPSIKVTDAYGCFSNATFPNFININPPFASIKVTIDSGCIPYTTSISDTISQAGKKLNYHIDSVNFGDGTPTDIVDTGLNITINHIYNTIGRFNIYNYFHLDSIVGGCSYVDSISIFAGTNPILANYLHAIPPLDSVCPHTNVRFYDFCSNCNSVTWNAGGSVFHTMDTSFMFTNFGSKFVMYVPNYNGCTDTLKNDSLYVWPPNVNFTISIPKCSSRDSFLFTNTSAPPTIAGYLYTYHYVWNFGDGSALVSTTATTNVTHVYTADGTYTVTLTDSSISPNPHSCSNSTYFPVYVYPVLRTDSTFYANKTLACKGNNIIFKGFLTQYGTFYTSYNYKFGDGFSFLSTANSDTSFHTYASPGVYTPKLFLINKYGCTDSITRPNYITIETPYPGLQVNGSSNSPNLPYTGCSYLTVNFHDSTTAFPGTSLNKRRWYFNAPPTVTGVNTPPTTLVTGTLLQTDTTVTFPVGLYHVVVIDTDNLGCFSTDTVQINSVKPHSYFTSNDTVACSHVAIHFHDTTTHVSKNWIFGDNSGIITSLSTDTFHYYFNNGLYSDTLITISDASSSMPLGCRDTSIRTNYVTIGNSSVNAGFNFIGISFAACPPLTIGTRNTSTSLYSNFYQWKFGLDSSVTTTSTNPSFTYSYPGNYTVTLIDSNTLGCKDTIRNTVSIGGPTGTLTILKDTLCAYEPTLLHISSAILSPGLDTPFIWTVGYGTFSTDTQGIYVAYTTAGNYHPYVIIHQISSGCSVTVNTTDSIKVFPLPVVSIPNDSICKNSSVIVNASGATAYSWSPAYGLSSTVIANPTANPTITTTYTVIGTSNHNCKDTVIAKVTVNPTPTAISGNAAICNGNSSTLSNGTTGGIWSSQNTAVAIIDVNGIVTGISPGTSTISYVIGNCNSTKIVTINIQPDAISGVFSLCNFANDTLKNDTTGGVWSSSTTTVATISNIGIVSGQSVGTSVISYSVGNCISLAVITVNTLPSAISGTYAICNYDSSTLINDSLGGNWSSINTNVATISNFGKYYGLLPGTSLISYTIGNCTATKTVTVHIQPDAISGTLSLCNFATDTLKDDTTGGVWASTSTSIVTINNSGIITGHAIGTSVISYSVGNCRSLAVITVNTLPSAITGTFAICNYDSTTLINDSLGGNWSSINTNVAIINNTGKYFGLLPGTSLISYTIGNCTSTKTITVHIQPDAIKGTLSLCNFATDTLMDDTTGGIWTSATHAVATINNNGVVTGHGVGTSVITYTVGSCKSTATVTVNILPSAILGTYSICNYDSTTLINDSLGGNWSSLNTNVATIGNTGKYYGLLPGTSLISYTIGNCTATKTITVHIQPDAISGNFSLCNLATDTLRDDTSGGIWASANHAVATINNYGVVTGHSVGTSFITYTVGSCKTITTITVNILPSVISGTLAICNYDSTILINDSLGGNWYSSNTNVSVINNIGKYFGLLPGTSLISYTIGNCSATKTITVHIQPDAISGVFAFCNYATDTLKNDSTGGVWSSITHSVATINSSNGVVTGVGVGTSVISYTIGNCSSKTVVTINAQPSPIAGGATTICKFGSSTLTDILSGGLWSSLNTNIATISNTGVVSAILPGTSQISYTLGSCFVTTTVTILNEPDSITGVNVVCAGATTSLNDITASGKWSCSNTACCFIDSLSGLVTGLSAGLVNISYTNTITGCSTSLPLTVNAIPLPISGTPYLCSAGQGSTLLNDATLGGTWSSSEPLIATIGATTGVVTGVTPGTPIITYSLSATGCYQVKPISVNTTPAAITGNNVICAGSVQNLTDATPGGLWISNSPSIASLISSGSTVPITGVSVGTTIISYIIGNCYAITTVTVNTQPTPITGTLSICNHAYSTLIESTHGGIWSSSNTTVASINPTGGTVTAYSAGMSTITYDLNNCSSIAILTVNSQPSRIEGNTALCTGTSATLTDSTLGGIWNSFTPAIASVTGLGNNCVINAIAAGTTVITYSLNSCYSIIPVTVYQQPSIIVGGNSSICNYSSIHFTDSIIGGKWFSDNPTIAIADSITGIITGSSVGSTTITYSIGNCYITKTITINTQPTPIYGNPTSICSGTTTTYYDTTASGTWFSTNPIVANISPTGVILGNTEGLSIISYTIGSCFDTALIKVTSQPSPIFGLLDICNHTSTTLSESIPGGRWSIINPSVVSVDSINTSTAVLTGISVGSSIISYTRGICYSVATISVNIQPAPIVGVDSVCKFSTTTFIDDSLNGKWNSINNLVATVDSNSGVVKGVYAGTVQDTTSIYYSIGNCRAYKVISVNPLPIIVGNDTVICKYTSGKLKVSGANKYLWSPAGSLSCNTCTNPTANPIVTTIYTITGTSNFGCISTKLLKDSVDAIGNIVFKGKDTICHGETDTLYVSGAKYFKWYPSTGLDCSVCDTTHSKPDSTIIYSLVATDSLGCHDTSTHKINVTQLAKLTSTLTPPLICTGTLFSYHDTCNIANTTVRWHRNQVYGITPAISNGYNSISEILYNSTLRKDTVYYIYVLNYLSCADSQKVVLAVDPLPTRPIISTTSPASLCANTLYQNFGASQAEPTGVNYTWSAKNGTIWAESPGKQNCVVNFYQPGISIVRLSANIIGSNCIISDSFSVAITPSESPIINVVYDNNNFICLLNTADSFQWGYDNVNTFISTSLSGEKYQNYYNPSPDFKSNYYWVKTAKDGCSQKSYYNSPTGIINVGIAEIQTIKVYPNPANELINIEISGNSFNEKTIQIFNLTGKLLKLFPAKNNMEVDISAFPPGFYFIGCYSNGIVNASTKFIKSVELK